MRAGDLATLADVKAWLNSGGQTVYPPGNDALLSRLITSCSAFVQNYLSRSIVPATYNEAYKGSGTGAQFLRQRPIIQVNSLTISGQTIQPSNPPSLGYGWLNDDSTLYFIGGGFPPVPQCVVVNYDAGFQATYVGIVQATINIASLGQPWNIDRGVMINNVAALNVSGTPAAGQYSLTAAADGSFDYNFNAADADLPLTITYGYTPFDLAQVVVETVGETFKRRNRIGESSVNMGNGQVVNFSLADFNAASKTLLQQYKNVVPV